MTSDKPYLERIVIERIYNPEYGDERVCECGHKYYRHFDTYEEMYNCGCKYCGCHDFVELTAEKENQIRELVKQAYQNAVDNGYDMEDFSVFEMAYDMADCDADLEKYDPNFIAKFIKEIRDSN